MIRLKPTLRVNVWWHEIQDHQYAVLVWMLLNLFDFVLSQVALSQGGSEINWFLRDLSPLVFALQKLFLTLAAITWLAMWKWLRFLKWLNILLVLVLASNIYDLIVRPVY